MKKLKYFLIILIVILSPIKMVLAASSCSYEEQVEFNNLAANVTASYEAVDIFYEVSNNVDEGGEPEDIYIRGLNISILNIAEGIYVKVVNTATNEEKIYHHKDTLDGVLTFQTAEVDDVTNYNIEIYADKYSCVDELYRSFTFTTPRYNRYSQLAVCNENPGFYYCQEFISSDNVDINSFFQNLNNYKKTEIEKTEEKNKTWWEKIKEFYEEHKIETYLTIGGIAIAGVATTVILVKKRRSRLL